MVKKDAVEEWVQVVTPADPAANYSKPYFKSDGKLYGKTGSIETLIGPPTVPARHSNPGFDGVWNVSAGHGFEPPSWSVFWQAASVTDAYDTTDSVSGGGSAKITQPNTGAFVAVRMNSGTAFGVIAGDTVTVSVWAKSNLPTPTLFVQLITGATSAEADVLGGGTSVVHGSSYVITSSWTLYSASFTVPSGHLFGRVSFAGDAIGAGSWWLDESGSVVVTPTPVLNQWAKQPVRVLANTSFVPATGAPLTVDGQTLVAGDRVLKHIGGSATDGLWRVVTPGSGSNGNWTRPDDYLTSSQAAGSQVAVQSGTVYGGTRWATSMKSTDGFTSGSSHIWSQVRGDIPAWRSLTLSTTYNMSTSMQVIGWNGINNGNSITLSGDTTRITVALAGVHYVSTECTFQQFSGAGNIWHIIDLIHRRGGTEVARREAVGSTSVNGDFLLVATSGIFDALAGDTFEVGVTALYTNLSNIQGSNRSSFNAHRLGSIG